jgi:hypothetical protein
MKTDSKALEFIYQDTQIHFLLSQGDDVMVNATEMAKPFGKEPKNFLRLEGTEKYIELLIKKANIRTDVYGYNENIVADVLRYNRENFVFSNNKAGTYMHRKLALKFAVWLDIEFEDWVIDTIDKILFGHYKEHWDAHIKQEDAKARMEVARKKLLLNANQEDVIAYFEAESDLTSAKKSKSKALKNQYSIFDDL